MNPASRTIIPSGVRRLAAAGLGLALPVLMTLSAASANAQGICYQENGGPGFNDGFFAGVDNMLDYGLRAH